VTTITYTTVEGQAQKALAFLHPKPKPATRPHLFRNHKPDFREDWWTKEQARRRKTFS